MLAAVDMHRSMVLRDYTTSRDEVVSASTTTLADIPGS